MILIYHFTDGVEEYVRLGKKNDFPSYERCPACSGHICLNRHGFYKRNAITASAVYRIPICRLRCPSCKTTFSLLPSFLIPYFQYTLDLILAYLEEALRSMIRSIYYQLAQFYRRRFLRNLNLVEMYFRDNGFKDPLPQGKGKAIKLLEMILLAGSTFLRGWNSHFTANFMARSL